MATRMHADIIRPSLRDIFVGGLVELGSRSVIVVMLEEGELAAETGDGLRRFVAPCLLWMPFERSSRMRARAGSAGSYVVAGEATIANAIGRRAEAADLRLIADRTIHLDMHDRQTLARESQACFAIILREASQAAPGGEAVVEAQLRTLLVWLWRDTAGGAAPALSRGGAGQVLMRFRHAVETHFRDRWPVARYAAELGVSADRLHEICSRELGRPPLRLIRERTNHEAQQLLARSAQTTDQIAAHLGFRSASQFRAFFRTMNDIPPGSFRRAVRRRETEPVSYADWP